MTVSPESEFPLVITHLNGEGDTKGDELAAEHPLPVLEMNSPEPLPEWEERSVPEVSDDMLKPPGADPPVLRSADGAMWLNGEVLMCGCPDCRSPMTIRLWLMVADCWKCGISIELSEQQQRAAEELLRRAREGAGGAPARRRESPTQPAARETRPAPPAAAAATAVAASATAPAAPPAGDSANEPPRPAANGQPRPRRNRRRRPQNRTGGAWLNRVFRDTPAWLVSLIFHLMLLTLLGILHLPYDGDDKRITLSTTVSPDVREGGDVRVVDPKDPLKFDLPTPPQVDMSIKEVRDAVVRADQDARQLRLDPDSEQPQLPDLDIVKSQIAQAGSIRRALAARDPRVRVEMVKKEGGTTLTEAAVARGLRWLSKHQNADGSWSLDRFHHVRGCSCRGAGMHSDSAGTALALLPFLGAGQTHLVGVYRDHVAKGLRWMVEHQAKDGDLRAGSNGNAGMYAHGQGAIVLCEAFLMTGDEQLREPAQRAINFIVAAQHAGGGWRYRPGERGDTSVLGWQLMALQSARAANLTVPDTAFGLASNYLDTVTTDGARYAYQPRRQRPTPAMTAEALLCRIYLGWKREDVGLAQGVRWLTEQHMPRMSEPNIYYWYYGTQTVHHFGGTPWSRWNLRMRDILVASQRASGHAAGSWDPRGAHTGSGGRIYMTALAVCTLEVYYRHLPIFRQIDLDAAEE